MPAERSDDLSMFMCGKNNVILEKALGLIVIVSLVSLGRRPLAIM